MTLEGQATAVREERRSQLLDAAERVVAQHGPDASMSQIAAEAGITKPILYRHFGDKAGLYRALAERHTDELLSELRAALRTPGTLRDRSRATIDAYLAAIERRPQIYRFLVDRAAAEEPEVHGHVTVFVRRLAVELAVGIRVELGWDGSEAMRAEIWAHAIVGMVRGAGEWWLDDQRVPRDEIVDALTELLFGAFAIA